MKNIKIQIFGFLILLCAALSLQGMLSSKTKQAHASYVKRLQSVAKQRRQATRYSPPTITMKQTRSYSGVTPKPPGPSMFDWLKKFLPFWEISPLEYSMNIDRLLNGHDQPYVKYPDGRIQHEKRVFDEQDFEKVMQALDLNKEYIMNYQAARSPNWEFIFKLNQEERKLNGTILDKVLFLIFNGDQFPGGSTFDFTGSESTLNYIKLAEYLVEQNVPINSENEEKYVKLYCNFLMPRYEKLSGPRTQARYGVDFELKILKEVFSRLDLLLEKLISRQDLKKQLKEAQNKRIDIENNTEAFKTAKEDEFNRDEYIFKKANYLQWEHFRKTENFDELEFPWELFRNRARKGFKEKDYQAWLASGKDKFFFHNQREQKGQEQNQQPGVGQSKPTIAALKKDLGLQTDTSNEMVLKLVRKYMMEQHPDKYPKGPLRDEQNKKFQNFMGIYDGAIKELERLVKKEREQRKRNNE